MDTVLSVGFIAAATAFFSKRLGLEDKRALGCAFLVSLFVGLAPTVAAQLPAFSPWADAIVKVIALFIASAGAYDLVMQGVREAGSA